MAETVASDVGNRTTRSANPSPSPMPTWQVSGPVLRLVLVRRDFHRLRLSVEHLGAILDTPAEPATIAFSRPSRCARLLAAITRMAPADH